MTFSRSEKRTQAAQKRNIPAHTHLIVGRDHAGVKDTRAREKRNTT
jgi:ATP sulfurylase